MVNDSQLDRLEAIGVSKHAEGRAAILARAPIVILGYANNPDLPLGMGVACGAMAPQLPACLLVGTSWSWNSKAWASEVARRAAAYEAAFPGHHIVFACNSDQETALFLSNRRPALTVNHNIFVNENVFRPRRDIKPIHDAVYNARLVDWKRHELAVEIEKLLLIYFHVPAIDGPGEAFHATHARYKEMLPKAMFANALTPTGCKKLKPDQVNEALASARVGLCLSAKEGAMTASMEYMLAGLPVVSTKSDGGRDYFFDNEYCLIVADDPRSVRDAVGALIARNIPREHIRRKTLARVQHERTRFAEFVQTFIDANAGEGLFLPRLRELIDTDLIRPWQSVRELMSGELSTFGA